MTGSTVTVTCWGCRKSETHPLVHGEEFDKQRQDMEDRGWRRRAFGPPSWDKGPWFCSGECAHESYNAVQAEEYWKNKDEEDRQREFQKYCRETKVPNYYVIVYAILLGAALSTFLLGKTC